MKLLLIVHKDDLRLSAFVEAAQQERLSGFTILPSHGIGQSGQSSSQPNHPLDFSIGGLSALFANARPENATVFALLEEAKLARALELLRTHLSDLDQPGGGIYAVLPVDFAGSLE